MTTWAKMAADLDSHPKIRKAGRDGREVFLFVIRRNSALDLGGRVPAIYVEPWYLAEQLMMTEDEARHGTSRAVTAGLLRSDGGFLEIVGWDDEWAKRPLTEGERQQRRRDKLKTQTELQENVTTTSRPESDCPDNHGSEERRGEEIRVEERKEEVAAHAARPTSSKRKPKPSEPTAEERDVAFFVLSKLSARSGVKYSGAPPHVRLIVARLREGYTEQDLRKVIGYCAVEKKWAGDPDMEQYLRPETLFGPNTIAKYIDHARTWFDKTPGLEFDERPRLEVVQ